MKKIAYFLGVIALFASCNKEKYFDGPDSYVDDFEGYSTLDELILDDNSRWSATQITREENSMVLSTEQAHSGVQSLKMMAAKSTEDIVSKCSIFKNQMAFYEGETVRLTAWYYIEGTQELDWMFLMDFEENTAIGAGPGMRIANIGAENYPVVEFKFKNGYLDQNVMSLPRNQWFKLTVETYLSQKKKGIIRLYVDDQLILEEFNTKTLPTDLLYNQQGTKGMYTNIEFGITANSFSNDAVMYLDDVSVEVIN